MKRILIGSGTVHAPSSRRQLLYSSHSGSSQRALRPSAAPPLPLSSLDGAPVAVPDKAPKGLAIFDVKDTCFVVVPAAPAGDRKLGITVTNAGGYAGLSHLIHY